MVLHCASLPICCCPCCHCCCCAVLPTPVLRLLIVILYQLQLYGVSSPSIIMGSISCILSYRVHLVPSPANPNPFLPQFSSLPAHCVGTLR